MNKLLAAVAALIVAGSAVPCLAQAEVTAAAAPAPDPDRLAAARELVDIAFPAENRSQLFANSIRTMMAQARAAMVDPLGEQLDEGARQIIERYLARMQLQITKSADAAIPIFFDAYARAYARQFTRDELIEITAFVTTPTGSKYFQRSSELLADPDFAAANTAYMKSALEALRPMQAELVQELTVYLKAQADKAND